MKRIGIFTLLMTVSCTSGPTHTRAIRYDDEVMLLVNIAGEGGALSEERYNVSYQFRGKSTTFFEGVNPRDFNVRKEGGAVSIKFCDGVIRGQYI